MRVLIIEDDERIARFIARVLAEDSFESDLCASGTDAVGQASSGDYDLILLDWMLPGRDGLEVCRELRRLGIVAPIIMLTARSELHEKVQALTGGADDYIVKPFEVDELLARIHAVLRRSRGVARVQIGALDIDRMQRRVTLDGRILELTAREYALLVFLASQPEQVVARSELLTHVWATQFDPGSNLIDVHVSRLRDKLGGFAWMIDTVRGKGYRLRPEQR